MQNRLLPLMFLLVSSQAYSESAVTESSATTMDDTQITSQPSESAQTEGTVASEQKPSTDTQTETSEENLSFEPVETEPEQAITFESTESTESDTPSKQVSDKATDEKPAADDDGIDEELISELLEEEPESTDDDQVQDPSEMKAEKAAEPVSTSSWLPEIEFGYRSEQGNEDERSLNARLSLAYISGRLRNTGEVKVYMKNEDGEEDEREQTYQLQSDYKISPKMYIYGNFKGIDSKYSSYFHDYTVSTGLGYQVTNTDTLTVETELGPGYRYQEPNTDEIDDDDPIFPENVDEPIIRANLTASWKPFDSTSFKFDGTVVSGSSNTRIDTEISIINNITEDVALKISQSRQHLSRVPNNLSKTDSTFTINILYSPK